MDLCIILAAGIFRQISLKEFANRVLPDPVAFRIVQNGEKVCLVSRCNFREFLETNKGAKFSINRYRLRGKDYCPDKVSGFVISVPADDSACSLMELWNMVLEEYKQQLCNNFNMKSVVEALSKRLTLEREIKGNVYVAVPPAYVLFSENRMYMLYLFGKHVAWHEYETYHAKLKQGIRNYADALAGIVPLIPDQPPMIVPSKLHFVSKGIPLPCGIFEVLPFPYPDIADIVYLFEPAGVNSALLPQGTFSRWLFETLIEQVPNFTPQAFKVAIKTFEKAAASEEVPKQNIKRCVTIIKNVFSACN